MVGQAVYEALPVPDSESRREVRERFKTEVITAVWEEHAAREL